LNDLFFARSQMGMSLAFHIQNAAAPESTLRLLLLALGAGAVILLPSLYYLFQIFRGQEQR
jgi:cytochrome bd-type quinol oxidase subunit 2